MKILYNEFDPFAAAWLGKLIDAGLIPKGDIDTRDIRLIDAYELMGYDQVHLFAGIGGWPYALNLAGWTRPVWTGSCPCQPFSVAGKRKGTADDRHLWPAMRDLIAECHPTAVFGEQVASKDGRVWLAGVRTDLEALGYAFGAADLCAAGVAAPHIRQRLFWVADANGGLASDGDLQRSRQHGQQPQNRGASKWVANTEGPERPSDWAEPNGQPRRPTDSGWMGNNNTGLEGRRLQPSERAHKFSPWASSAFVPCTDGKARRIEPSIQPLAHGVPNRVGTLRGAGNAIVPQVASEFIKSFMDVVSTKPAEDDFDF